ncbi:MAG: hypothetical protein Q9217_001833 [Psora testacea]
MSDSPPALLRVPNLASDTGFLTSFAHLDENYDRIFRDPDIIENLSTESAVGKGEGHGTLDEHISMSNSLDGGSFYIIRIMKDSPNHSIMAYTLIVDREDKFSKAEAEYIESNGTTNERDGTKAVTDTGSSLYARGLQGL